MGALSGNHGRQDVNHHGEQWSVTLELSLTCGSRTEMACERLEVEPQMGRSNRGQDKGS